MTFLLVFYPEEGQDQTPVLYSDCLDSFYSWEFWQEQSHSYSSLKMHINEAQLLKFISILIQTDTSI